MRKRPPRVERQRCQYGEDHLGEILLDVGLLPAVQVGIAQEVNAGFLQIGQEIVLIAVTRLRQQLGNGFTNGRQLFGGGQAIEGKFRYAGGNLLLEAGDAHHEELIQVGADDRQKFDPLEQWIALIPGLFQDAAEKLQLAEFAVEIHLRTIQIRRWQWCRFYDFRCGDLPWNRVQVRKLVHGVSMVVAVRLSVYSTGYSNRTSGGMFEIIPGFRCLWADVETLVRLGLHTLGLDSQPRGVAGWATVVELVMTRDDVGRLRRMECFTNPNRA